MANGLEQFISAFGGKISATDMKILNSYKNIHASDSDFDQMLYMISRPGGGFHIRFADELKKTFITSHKTKSGKRSARQVIRDTYFSHYDKKSAVSLINKYFIGSKDHNGSGRRHFGIPLATGGKDASAVFGRTVMPEFYSPKSAKESALAIDALMTAKEKEQSRFANKIYHQNRHYKTQDMMDDGMWTSQSLTDPFDDEGALQASLGADTGANRNGDFAYLAEQEKAQGLHRYRLSHSMWAKRREEIIAKRKKNALTQKAHEKFAYMTSPEKAQRLYELREAFGGDSVDESSDLALAAFKAERSQKAMEIRKARRSRDRKNANKAEQDEKKLRDMLLKGLPPFLRDSKMSTKDLKETAEYVKNTKKMPLGLGHLALNPWSAGITAAGFGMKMIGGIIDTADNSNAKVLNWQNAQNLYGSPSKAFTEAAYKAGLKDPAEIAKLYGQLTMQFGSAEAGIQAIGSQMSNLPPIARMAMAKSLGLDEKSMALFDIMSGNGHLKVSKAREIAANRSIVDVEQALGFSSDTGVIDFVNAATRSIPGQKGARARDRRNGWDTDSYYELADSAINASVAAESLARKEASGDTITTTSTNTFVFNGDIVANDPQQLIQKTGEMVNGGNTEVLERFNNRVNGAKR